MASLQPGDSVEAGLRTVRHRNRHRAVQLNDRRRAHTQQRIVEHGYRAPVGVRRSSRLCVLCRNRGLQRIAAGLCRAHCGRDERKALFYLRAVPQRAILLFEQNQVPVGVGPRCATGFVQQHQRRQSAGLVIIGQKFAHHAREPDRFAAEFAAHQRVACRRRVTFVEDQVDNSVNRVDPLGQQLIWRHRVGDTRRANLALGPNQPLRHRGSRHQEGARDFLGRKPAQRPQRQRDLRLERECRMAAGENQTKTLIGHRAFRFPRN